VVVLCCVVGASLNPKADLRVLHKRHKAEVAALELKYQSEDYCTRYNTEAQRNAVLSAALDRVMSGGYEKVDALTRLQGEVHSQLTQVTALATERAQALAQQFAANQTSEWMCFDRICIWFDFIYDKC
jgi:hypothetical protein